MKAKYFGKRIKRNEFGDVVARYSPCVTISFPEKEASLARARLEATGYQYDMYMDGISSEGFADVHVASKEEATEFMAAWKEAKKRIKEVP